MLEMMMLMRMKKSTSPKEPVMVEKEKEKASVKHLFDAHPRVAPVVPGAGAGAPTGGAARPRWCLRPRRKEVRVRKRVRRASKGQKRQAALRQYPSRTPLQRPPSRRPNNRHRARDAHDVGTHVQPVLGHVPRRRNSCSSNRNNNPRTIMIRHRCRRRRRILLGKNNRNPFLFRWRLM
jgi:hypothetical protein